MILGVAAVVIVSAAISLAVLHHPRWASRRNVEAERKLEAHGVIVEWTSPDIGVPGSYTVDFTEWDGASGSELACLSLGRIEMMVCCRKSVGAGALIPRLNECDYLRVLLLDDTPVTDHDLSTLAHVESLEELTCSNTRVNGHGFRHLANLPLLQELDVEGCSIEDRYVQDLSRCKNLRVVNLANTGIGDTGAIGLANCGQVESIDMSSTNVTERGLKWMSTSKSLRRVYLMHSPVGDGIAEIVIHSQIRSINLRDTHVSAAAIARIRRVAPDIRVTYEED